MPKRRIILAMAVGPSRNMSIKGVAAAGKVRPYIAGLIAGLKTHNRRIGTDFLIDYRERPDLGSKSLVSDAFRPDEDAPYDLIFGMSTTVVRAAKSLNVPTPIVGVVSDLAAEGLKAGNVTGISARRSQSSDRCLESFLATVPSMTRLYVLHKRRYGPSVRSLSLVRKVAKQHGVAVRVVAVTNRADITAKLGKLPKQNAKAPPTAGLMVLPIDFCLGFANGIVSVAQGQKRIPVFFPITDCVTARATSALGGRGVPQRRCGELMADYVHGILWRGKKASALKIAAVGDGEFQWAVSSKAARALNVNIPHVV